MKREINTLGFLYLFALALLVLPSAVSPPLGTAVYFFALSVPILIGIFLVSKFRRKEALLSSFRVSCGDILFSVPLIFPTVALTTGISYITALVIGSLTGAENTVTVGDNLPLAITAYALLPAVFEELLFRFLPLAFIGERSPRACVLVSAISFSLVHHSFFSFPYAFFAGAVFMALDLAANSVIPSVIFHFINNLFSVLWIFYSGSALFSQIYFGALLGLSLLSGGIIFALRRKYGVWLSKALRRGEKCAPGIESLFFMLPPILIAILELC